MTLNRLRVDLAVLLVGGCFLMSAMLLPASAQSETLYVKRSGTKLRASATARSPVVRVLAIGAPVDVLKKSRIFYEVKLPQGDMGWVYKFKLTKLAPVDPAFDPGLWGVLGGGPVIAAKESDSGSMIRGLKPLLEERAKERGASAANIQAVETMEAPKVTPEELDAFLSARKIGQFQQEKSEKN